MIIRVFILILWLLLGVFYYSLYINSKATCCTQEAAITPIVSASDIQDSIHQKSNQTEENIEENSTISDSTLDNSTISVDTNTIDNQENIEENNNEHLKEPEKAIIFFPQNSKTRLTSETLEKYLDDIAKRVTDSREVIELYGHTDKLGTNRENIALGLARAKTIKALLIKRGVPSVQIKVHSKGSEEPIGNNKTREGRSKNRRVELFIK